MYFFLCLLFGHVFVISREERLFKAQHIMV